MTPFFQIFQKIQNSPYLLKTLNVLRSLEIISVNIFILIILK